MRIRLYIFSALLILCFTSICIAQGINQRAMFWTNLTQNGLLFNKNWEYFLEAQARLNSEKHVFNQGLIRAGVGRHINKVASIWLGYDYTRVYSAVSEKLQYGQSVWQQLLLNLFVTKKIDLSSRSRLVEAHLFGNSDIGLVWRQKFTLVFSGMFHHRLLPVVDDEIFFNLNHPGGENRHAINQNRFFIGVLIPLEKDVVARIGYMNQYQIRPLHNVMSHIFYVTLFIRNNLV